MILLVEDETRVASFIKKGLEENGITVEVAVDGQQGFNDVRLKSYEAVILDINLPKINGIELCKRIREINPNMPVLMLIFLY